MKDKKEILGFEGAKILLQKLNEYQNEGKDPRITYGEMAVKLGLGKDYSRVVDSFFGRICASADAIQG